MKLAIIVPYFVPGTTPSERILRNQKVALEHFRMFSDRVVVPTAPLGLGIWNKERLINHAVSQLPAEYDTVAWIDGDLHLHNSDWPRHLELALQKHLAVQLFSEVVRLSPDGALEEGPKKSSASMIDQLDTADPYSPGYAWGAHRELFENGGLYDGEIIGGGDSATFYGWLSRPWHAAKPAGQQQHYDQWKSQAGPYVWGQVGFIPGLIAHSWHGQRQNRNYYNRHEILKEEGFDPHRDLRVAEGGYWEWTAEAPVALIRRMHAYFAGRKDDG